MKGVCVSVVVLVLSMCVSLTRSQCFSSACVNVVNDCGATLFVQRTVIDGPEGTPTSVTSVPTGGSTILDISGWIGLPGQRLYAWWQNPIGGNPDPMSARDKVEINICSASPVRFCYNPTAVDYFGLPVYIGPTSNVNCPSVSFTGNGAISISQIASQCDTLYTSAPPFGVCKSSGAACALSPSLPLCSYLDPTVRQCVNDGVCPSGSTTQQVYQCSDWFSQQPGYCAALNRGVYPSLSQNDPSQFYLKSPYNNYSAWIHQKGENEYAFPYDDYQGAGSSGYNECTTNMLTVKWCPSH